MKTDKKRMSLNFRLTIRVHRLVYCSSFSITESPFKGQETQSKSKTRGKQKTPSSPLYKRGMMEVPPFQRGPQSGFYR